MENTHIMNYIMTEFEICESALRFGFVKFMYRKVSGEIRVAIGTKNLDYLKKIDSLPSGDDKRGKYQNLCTYYDLVRGAWRCFRKDLFEHLVFDNLTKEEACTQALAIAIKDQECDVESVMRDVTMLIGTDSTSKITDFVCGHITDDADEITTNCMHDVFNISVSKHTDLSTINIPINIETIEPTESEHTQMSIINKENLLDELMRLRQRESEIILELFRL